MGIKLFSLLIAGVVLSAAPLAKPAPKRNQVSTRNSSARTLAGSKTKTAAAKPRVVRRRGAMVSPSRLLAARYTQPDLSTFPEMAPPLPDMAANELRDSFFAARVGRRVHQAIDIMRPAGTPLYSCVDGFIDKLNTSALGGIAVYLADATGQHRFYYAHMSAYAEGVTEGMPVLRGQLIGYVGNTGNARFTGPHLHFQIIRGGGAVNPFPVLRNVVDGGGLQIQPALPSSLIEHANPERELVPTAAPVPEPVATAAADRIQMKPVAPSVSSPLVVPNFSVADDGR